MFLVGVPFAIVPDLANLKGSVSTSVVLQSYIVVYGLVLTLTATTATLNANHAREIVRDLREMQPVDQGGAQDLAEAINLAEGLRKDVFISEVFVYGCIPRRHCHVCAPAADLRRRSGNPTSVLLPTRGVVSYLFRVAPIRLSYDPDLYDIAEATSHSA